MNEFEHPFASPETVQASPDKYIPSTPDGWDAQQRPNTIPATPHLHPEQTATAIGHIANKAQ